MAISVSGPSQGSLSQSPRSNNLQSTSTLNQKPKQPVGMPTVAIISFYTKQNLNIMRDERNTLLFTTIY